MTEEEKKGMSEANKLTAIKLAYGWCDTVRGDSNDIAILAELVETALNDVAEEMRTAYFHEIDSLTDDVEHSQLSIRLAYGLIWKSTSTDPLTHIARKTLLDSLSKDEQRAAVKWVIETYGPMTTSQLIAADLRAGVFPERSSYEVADAGAETT